VAGNSKTQEQAAGLSGCCPDQAADSALRYRDFARQLGYAFEQATNVGRHQAERCLRRRCLGLRRKSGGPSRLRVNKTAALHKRRWAPSPGFFTSVDSKGG
jgi:hypothetical protein